MDKQEQKECEDMATIRMKRGIQSDVETMPLLSGEMAVALDTGRVYVGTEEGTVPMMGDGGDMDTSVYDPQKKKQDIFAYVDQKRSKRTARFIIGTASAGWTQEDCDYLCDGIDDQEEILNAYNALPDTGGEIVLLSGKYSITENISLREDDKLVILRGNGKSTVLSWEKDVPYAERSTMILETAYISLFDLCLDGNQKADGIFFGAGHVANNLYNCFTVMNNVYIINTKVGVRSGGAWYENFAITNCYFASNEQAMNLFAERCILSNNIFRNNDSAIDFSSRGNYMYCAGNSIYKEGEYTSSQYTIKLASNSTKCVIVGNVCIGKAPTISGTGNIVDNNVS